MTKPRIIPVLLLKNGLLVRSQLFKIHQAIGAPQHTIRRLSKWSADELILLDISKEDFHDLRRDDMQVKYAGSSILGLLEQISEVCFMPLATGGRIRSVEDMRQRLSAGADKCIINTASIERPELISEGAEALGSQCIVVSIDAFRDAEGRYEVRSGGGSKSTGLDPIEWARECEARGAGEILINSIDRDGTGLGYDLELVSGVVNAVSIPVIACGGVGKMSDFPKAITGAGASAAAAANIFHFTELAYQYAKKACEDAGVHVRPLQVSSRWVTRYPTYDLAEAQVAVADRLDRARNRAGPKRAGSRDDNKVRWCTKCLYPSLSATPMEFDETGLCMGCRVATIRVEWSDEEKRRRKERLVQDLESGRSKDGTRHDCLIAVSGGKDSYFQTHYIKNVLGFNPLLVTYYGNNFTEVGNRNLYRMKEAFGVDHIIYQPGVENLIKLNRLGLIVMGDMNWHNHIGLSSIPWIIAAQFEIPIVIYGEHGYADLCGQFSDTDYVEWTYRYRLEHALRGFEWNYMVGMDGITASQMFAYQYPSDEKIWNIGMRGLYLANYVEWDGNRNAALMQELYGFEISEQPFDRTYRRASNLDDMHENGVHDYLKFVKFGYGRCTDHASKDIRLGIMSRKEGIEMVKKYDHVKPSDLARWLDYVGMSESDFDAIADTFRDPRVWWRDGETWCKRSLWD